MGSRESFGRISTRVVSETPTHPNTHPKKKDKTEFLGGASRLAHIDVGGFKGMDSQAEMADWRQVKPKGLFFQLYARRVGPSNTTVCRSSPKP